MDNTPDGHDPDVTRLLRQGGEAASELLPVVYAQLRAIAQERMGDERPGHTLQATALVHEAYLRLVSGGGAQWAGRAHFFHAAAEAMRRILIEHARARGRVKRGGGRRRIPISVLDLAEAGEPGQIVALDEAIRRLEERDPTAGSVVRLRFYAGLSVAETAETLGVSVRTVLREWSYARAVLYRTLEKEEPDAGV
jgi:RNA polymerase sigma factor (TIGR02999 family)